MPTNEILNFGMPWEAEFGYVQARKVGEFIFVSGQLSHDQHGNMVAPAPLDEQGVVRDFANMEAQISQSYANLGRVLDHFGISPLNVVEEVLYVLDMNAAFAAAGPVRKRFYATDRPQVASTLLVTPRLAFPSQLVEIKFVVRA
ncbi:MAG: RidA family protein [Burkholderiales bacterium]